jgi:hypothetical protein
MFMKMVRRFAKECGCQVDDCQFSYRGDACSHGVSLRFQIHDRLKFANHVGARIAFVTDLGETHSLLLHLSDALISGQGAA